MQVVGDARIDIENRLASNWQLYKAQAILPICIKPKLPSWIRAPPEAHTIIRGRNSRVAYSIKRVICSPTADLTVPAIN